MINTTSTNVNTEQKEKQKATPFLEQISLRDYFAAKAMAGICASGPTDDFTDNTIAREAYNLADAMLKARGAV